MYCDQLTNVTFSPVRTISAPFDVRDHYSIMFCWNNWLFHTKTRITPNYISYSKYKTIEEIYKRTDSQSGWPI